MHLFRLRLILALIACVTVVSLASTYFDVLAHKHFLREDLERRTGWMGASIQPDLERTIAIGNSTALPALIEQSKARIGALGLAVYGDRGQLLAWAGPASLLPMLPPESLERSLRKGANVSAFGHSEDLSGWKKCFLYMTVTDWRAGWYCWPMRDTSAARETKYGGEAFGESQRW